MAQIKRAEGQIDIKSKADNFFQLWTRNSQLISEWCPEMYPKIELHHGDYWHALGAVSTWHFIAFGVQDLVKIKVKEIDEKNKYVVYDYFEGHGLLIDNYKHLKSKIQVIPKDDGCIVKWVFEYEKRTDNALDADVYVHFLLDCAKKLDARLSVA